MTDQDLAFLNKINKYAEDVLGDIDPQKTQVSFQLDKLRPIMQQIAMEMQMPVEDVFIKYMDLASEAKVLADAETTEKYGLNDTVDIPLNFKL